MNKKGIRNGIICGVICAGLAFGLGYLVCFYTNSSIYAAITKEENPYVSCAQMVKRTTQDWQTIAFLQRAGDGCLPKTENEEKSIRIYEHWTDFREDFDLPYASQEMVDILKEEYGKISFYGTFEQGDPECYDEYKAYFLKLVNNEIPFMDMETGEQCYLKDVQDLEDLELFRDESLPVSDRKLYYFFDADGDGAPELGVRNPYHHTTQYIFRYDREKEECF